MVEHVDLSDAPQRFLAVADELFKVTEEAENLLVERAVPGTERGRRPWPRLPVRKMRIEPGWNKLTPSKLPSVRKTLAFWVLRSRP